MKLSEHFSAAEFRLEGHPVVRVLNNARWLCDNIMEPIRKHFDASVMVTSGYRDAGHNAKAGGKAKSFHLYEDDKAACDFVVAGVDPVIVFEWLRLESKLPFDKVILESKNGVPVINHVQIFAVNKPRRQAFIGETGDATHYDEVAVL